ncbi:MAG: DNA-protecting protein DprA, partial [Chloroflexi bacterium]|nr:DNA-protecting protein DprA [Chloroflexota bacterium]
MSGVVSLNTQAVLLLTAPLTLGRGEREARLLTPGEFNRLARCLADDQREPADLLGPEANELQGKCHTVVDRDRLEKLLGRGFLLSQALERWETRSIWVASRLDPEYPGRLRARLKDGAPAILYGCGEPAILESGGLAVVGSRDVSEALLEYAEDVGRLAARARCTVVSGAARGIDQASMRGALQVGGRVVGVLSDSLERTALAHETREFLMDERLVLVCPYDPLAGFSVGQAMQRNKLIYALADAALVVSSSFETGGTWAGAVEQLEKLRFVPVYVRSDGVTEKGLAALLQKGARPWPDPSGPEELAETLAATLEPEKNESPQP